MARHCGHKPNRAACPTHGQKWREFHSPELREKYGVEAVFYCSVAGCGKFEIFKANSDLIGRDFTDVLWTGLLDTIVLVQVLLIREKRTKWKRRRYSG